MENTKSSIPAASSTAPTEEFLDDAPLPDDVTDAVEQGRAAAIRAATANSARVVSAVKHGGGSSTASLGGASQHSINSSSCGKTEEETRSENHSSSCKARESAKGSTATPKVTKTNKKTLPEASQSVSPNFDGSSSQVVLSSGRYSLLVCLAVVGAVLGTIGSGMGIAAFVDVNSQDTGNTVGASQNSPNQEDLADALDATPKSTLEQAYERGYVKCGLVSVQPGFLYESGKVDAATGEPELVGFDVDLCSAIAAALLGDPNAYEPYTFTWGERWTMLNSTTVDLVFRSTHNMERDLYISEVKTGFEFSTPYFYDGMIFAGVHEYVRCAQALSTNGTCADLKVCVADGTTTIEIVNELFPPENVLGITEAVSAAGDFLGHFPHDCNVIASEQVQASEQTLRQQGYTGPYTVGTEVFSKEPLCMVTRENDPLWTDFVETVLQALLYAETEGITQVTASNMPTTNLFGERFMDMYRNAVAAHGNYGQMYNTNFENFMQRSGQNLLESNGLGAPKIWAFPYGPLTVTDPRQLELASPTVRAIKQRGFLNCGKADFPGFSALNATTLEFEGFDIDLCRAVSAALFDGVVEHTVFTNTNYQNRWSLLHEERVDMLAISSTITVGRNVKEASTSQGFTFTDAFLFFSYSFGGLPEFVQCAEDFDVVSVGCQDLRVCSYPGAATDDLTERLGRDFYVIEKNSPSAIVQGLRDGECNVIYESSGQVQESMVRLGGYGDDLPYVMGLGQFYLEPTGIITRQDDPLWSDFVYWVLSSLVYAEEEGITRDTAELMPRTNIFGPYRMDSFVHAVQAVGNFGDIYARNFESIIPRDGLNELNRNNQPRMYAIPGFDNDES